MEAVIFQIESGDRDFEVRSGEGGVYSTPGSLGQPDLPLSDFPASGRRVLLPYNFVKIRFVEVHTVRGELAQVCPTMSG